MTATSRAQVGAPTGMVVSRSINMVAGDKWPTGDPYLQRQNEPSVAASTRNPQHLLAGANDYRTVDMPGLPSETGDAWLGIFKSVDGGERWQTTLLPGYPQDTSVDGMASPIKGYQAGADPVVRPGTNGLLYYAGLAFNRGENQPSAVFLSRFIDNNNTENGDPIKYLGTTIIDKSTGADFIDKPWMAVDIPRTGAKSCRIIVSQPPPAELKPGQGWGRYSGWKKSEEKRREHERDDAKRGKKPLPKPSKDPRLVAQSIDAGRIYVAYSRIKTVGTAIESRIMFSQSDDCGANWTKPVQLSNPADKVNQGATVAVDPKSGAVYVAWRQFGMTVTETDSVMVAKMPAPGRGFDAAGRVRKFNAHRPTERLRRMIAEHQGGDADEVAEIQPFDQGTAEDRIRTNAYPTMAIDDDGRAYVAWTERGFGRARPNSIDPVTRQPLPDGDARVVISTSRNGAAWTAPQPVDAGNGAAMGTPGADMPGHQLMPSISFAAGRLVVVYYDLREDVSRVFGPFIDEGDAVATVRKRHTIDIRAVYALKGDAPVFGPSQQVSQYLQGNLRGSTQVGPLQANAPMLPLFKLGTVPFLGDYIDIAPSPAFVQNAKGMWGYNTTAQAAPVFHVVWTDNRDVQKPLDGDWTHYTPVGAADAAGKYTGAPSCVAGQAGMRNQNIYSARLTWGLVAGSPGNTKPLDPTMPRGFVVFAQNTTTTTKTFRFSIPSQPVGGFASFTQAAVAGTAYPLLSLDVSVAPKSMVTRTVFVTSSDPKAQVPVDIKEVTAPNQSIVTGGLASRVMLNPDVSNPEISNPEISNPEISNPEISNAEIYNPEISNPEISNPEISNPEISNPEISNPEISNIVIANPEISNPEISNPEISNPEISNPEISNPEISNLDIANGAITDVTWTIVNTGNTTASFNVNLFLANAAAKLAGPGGTGVSGGIKTQLVVHKSYTTPIALGCSLKQEPHTVLVANVLFPKFSEPGTSTAFDPENPDVTNTTLWLEPGGEGKITLRIVDPNPQDGITLDPVHDVTPVITAEPKNTTDVGTPVTPPSTTPPAMPSVSIAFTAQPSNTIVNGIIAPIAVHAQMGAAPGAGVQVTLAIGINPAGGHLNGTTTVLTDANGIATFPDLSIEKIGAGYRLSVSASASGAVPDLSMPFDVTYAPTVATATGGTFVYDGTEHAGGCSVVGPGNVALTGSRSYSSGSAPVNAGHYTVTCQYFNDGYYAASDNTVDLTVTPAPSSTTVACTDTTYTGAAIETCTATVTGAGGLSLTPTPTYVNNTNAGTATASYTYAGDGNHDGSTASAPFAIGKATPTATATGGTFTFDGSAHGGTCAISDGLTGATTYAPGGTAPANVGDYTLNCDYAGDANHNSAHSTAAIKINPSPAAITSVSPVNGQTGHGFLVVRGSNLPTDVAVVVSGATTQSGFVYQSPSTSTAVWVRLPGGQPLGPGTIQLKNAAGTIVSNAFALTLTAVPGTPVITALRDAGFSLISAPVTPGSTLYVAADGIDTTGAVVRFAQGATTWDVASVSAVSNAAIGLTAQVTVPAAATGGPIDVSIRQGASAFSAPVSISVAAAAPTLAGSAGGPGGTPFGPIMCPAGTVATALRGRAGDDIDRTELWCAPVSAGPSIGAAAFVGGVGGFGGNDYGATLTCPAGSVMTGIHGRAGTVLWGGNVVDTLGVTCTNVMTAAVFTSATVGNAAPSANPFAINCPAGQEVVGIEGGQGGLLDRIGIYCGNRVPPGPVPSQTVSAGTSSVQSRPAPTASAEPAWFDPRRQLR